MTPYRVHLDAWTVGLYSTDDGRLTLTVTNSHEEDALTRLVGEIRLQRHYIGSMCAGTLRPSPFRNTHESYKTAPTRQQIIARSSVSDEGA
jgi:hypothetical protein